eukprot:TRINITY_DN27711_c0_g1_i1.p1 TRINITY_DN27711_c0_g1~~TRINITY_DN27711_c0_g1_i1.p1  ORF type:complete len:802 (+),score=189.53 TRINITY_DN27711_c0_g1_i1:3-2408(+)
MGAWGQPGYPQRGYPQANMMGAWGQPGYPQRGYPQANMMGAWGQPMAPAAFMPGASGTLPAARSSISADQRKYMERIVQAMQSSNIGMVAGSLSEAVAAKVAIPDAFLNTVKQWMTSRQESHAASAQMQMLQLAGAAVPTTSVAPQMPMLQTQPAPLVPRMPMMPVPGGAVGNHLPQPSSQQPGAAINNDMQVHRSQGLHRVAPSTAPMSQPPNSARSHAAPALRVPGPMVQATHRLEPSLSVPAPSNAPSVPSSGPSSQHLKKEEDRIDTSPADDEDDGFFGEPAHLGDAGAFHTPVPPPPAPRPPLREAAKPKGRTAQEVADFLRLQEAEAATFRQICAYFSPAPTRDEIQRLVEANEEIFFVEGDKVTLRDPRMKEARRGMEKELARPALQRSEIKAEEACEALWCAAHLALQASAKEVCILFETIAKKTLKKKMKPEKNMYPANMPLALACIIDRIVVLERRAGRGARLERALSPCLPKIFGRWIMGLVHGSQFLANLLLAWERSGWFQTKHLDKCREKLWLLVAYARSDGVPDAPEKDEGRGWYKVVSRDEGEYEGSESLLSAKQLEEHKANTKVPEEPPPRIPSPIQESSSQATAAQMEEKRARTLHALDQMGLVPKEAATQPVTKAAAEEKPQVPAQPATQADPGEKPQDQPATLDVDVIDEEDLFGSPADMPEDVPTQDLFGSEPSSAQKSQPPEAAPPTHDLIGSEEPSSAKLAPEDEVPTQDLFGSEEPSATPEQPPLEEAQRDTLAYADEEATQPYPASQAASSQGDGLAATQAYQDEPPSKRAKVEERA